MVKMIISGVAGVLARSLRRMLAAITWCEEAMSSVQDNHSTERSTKSFFVTYVSSKSWLSFGWRAVGNSSLNDGLIYLSKALFTVAKATVVSSAKCQIAEQQQRESITLIAEMSKKNEGSTNWKKSHFFARKTLESSPL